MPSIRPTHYQVSALPAAHPACRDYALDIHWHHRTDTWSVAYADTCHAPDGTGHPQVADCHIHHRYPLDRAIAIAERAAPHVTVNGRTVADALARSQEADPT
ncbi:hypothetical protein ACIBSV_46985 [Embleya sp. NPDC050154]|uniref:hypothetical protein n=1 Tax=Embleya sp. NPDC050154 TaxID=3363988 RepID=UPI003789F0BC